MRKILIATHGTLASGAKSTIELLMGNMADITCINAYVDSEENLMDRLDDFFEKITEEDEVIVFTDIKGGSVNQKIVPYAKKENIFLIAGFNLPILLEIVIESGKLTKERVLKTIGECKNQMELIEVQIADDSEEDFLA